MSKLIEGKIECPYYLKEGNGFIKCEGCIRGTECVHRFHSDAQKVRYEEKVCSNLGGRSCEHYRVVSRLYETGVRV